MSFVRFVVHGLDARSGRRQGLFQALAKLYDQDVLLSFERELYEETRAWFNENLERPEAFSRSGLRDSQGQAISWFKDSAGDHISRMRTMAAILEEHGVRVEMIQSDRPGYIVYEDEFQVAAEPFSETMT